MTMAYNTKELHKMALEAIEENRLFTIQDVVDYLGVSKATLYEHFKINSDEMNEIKQAIQQNKIRIKVSLRAKMARGDNPTAMLALYKLICTDEERRRLSMQDVNLNVTRDDMPAIDLGKLTKEERAQFYELYEKARITDRSETIDIDYEDADSNRKALGDGG